MTEQKKFKDLLLELGLAKKGNFGNTDYSVFAKLIGLKEQSIKTCLTPSKPLPKWAKAFMLAYSYPINPKKIKQVFDKHDNHIRPFDKVKVCVVSVDVYPSAGVLCFIDPKDNVEKGLYEYFRQDIEK